MFYKYTVHFVLCLWPAINCASSIDIPTEKTHPDETLISIKQSRSKGAPETILSFNDLPLCRDRSYARVCIIIDDGVQSIQVRKNNSDSISNIKTIDRPGHISINQKGTTEETDLRSQNHTDKPLSTITGQTTIGINHEEYATEKQAIDSILQDDDLHIELPESPDSSNTPAEQLQLNTSFEFENYLTIFYDSVEQSTNTDNDTAQFWSHLTISSNAMLNDHVILNLEGNISYSTYDHMLHGSFREPHTTKTYPAYIDTDVLSLIFEYDEHDFLVGKDKISIGLSEIYSPINRFGISNAVNPQHLKEMGVLQGRYRLYIDDDIFSILIIPYEEHPPAPDPSSRWLGTTGDADFISVSGLPTGYSIKDGYHSVNLRNAGYLATYDGMREGYDFMGMIHHGPSAYPVLVRDGLVFTKEYPISTSIGGAITAVYDAWKLYSEAIYQQTEHNADQNFVKYVVGVSYKETEFSNSIGIDEIQPIIEYSGEDILEEQDNPKYFTDSKNARLLNDSVIAQIQLTFNEKWQASIHSTKNLEHKDYSFGAGVKYAQSDNLKFYISGSYYHGSSDTAYGRWKQNDNLELGFNYQF